MNSRDRFRETMRYGTPDRVPYFEEGIRDDVLRAWRRQGLRRKSEFEARFRHDRREEIYPGVRIYSAGAARYTVGVKQRGDCRGFLSGRRIPENRAGF